MRTTRLFAIAAVGFALTGSGAWAQANPAATDLIDTLNTVCVAAQGDREKAAALAVEAGFSPAPATVTPPIRNASEVAMFIRSNATDVTILMTGKITRRVGRDSVVMDACGVTTRPTDHRALETRLREVMGFASIPVAGVRAYAWLQTPEGRAPTREITDPQFLAMARTGQMRMVALDRQGPGSSLVYFLPRVV